MRKVLFALVLVALAPWVGGATAVSALPVSPRAAAVTSSTLQQDARSAVARTSSLFAIDQDHHTVVMFPADGRPPRTVVGGLADPRQIAVDSHNNVFVFDAGTGSLIKADAVTGQQRTLRSNSTVYSFSMAVDGLDNLYLLDAHAIIKVAAATGRQSVLGVWSGYGILTVDAAGQVSITGSVAGAGDGVSVVATLSATGGAPTYRVLGTQSQPAYVAHARETPSGTMYVELGVGGASGADYVVRLLPGSSVRTRVNTRFADYAFAVSGNGTFYLMQDRYWCPFPGRASGQCVDDAAVDSVVRFADDGRHLASWRVSHLSLPEGGMAVDENGNVYAALVPIDWGPEIINSPLPKLVRINPGGGLATLLANGHFLQPTIARS